MSMTITIDAAPFARAAGVLEAETARIERELLTLTQKRAKLAKEALQRATPVREPQPGAPAHEHMRDLWHQETTGPSESLVFNDASYSQYLFTGTSPHEITPRTASALHFYAGGSEVFTGHVSHPGSLPDPKLTAVLDSQVDKAAADLFAFGVAEVERLAGAL